MPKFIKINPMVRAIGTMGAVAALVGGITFAQGLSSNTVALSPNNITTGTAAIQISPSDGTTCGTFGSSTTGLQDTSLAPGSSTSVDFCLNNNGSIPLTLTASIPQSLTTSVAAQNTTLTVNCTPNEGSLSATLSSWGPGTFGGILPSGATDQCTATAALSTSYTGSGGEAIPAFSIDFIGNQ